MKKLNNSVLRLDGYLSSLSSLSGRLRDYSAYSFALDFKGDGLSLEATLQKRFRPQANLSIKSQKELTSGLRDLESEIRPFLIRDLIGLSDKVSIKDEVHERNKYLSFRIIEMIFAALDGAQASKVFKLDVAFDTSPSICVLFVIIIDNALLVLQFNDDRPFKKEQVKQS